jgi:hypothetical protein
VAGQSERASDAQRAVAYAEDALRVPGTNAQTRAWCSRQAAVGHAMAGGAASCERYLADAYGLLDDDDSPALPWAGEFRVDRTRTLVAETHCWLNDHAGEGDRALRGRATRVAASRATVECIRPGSQSRARRPTRAAARS